MTEFCGIGLASAQWSKPVGPVADVLGFLPGDGEMAVLTRTHNLLATSFGPTWLWPRPLRVVLRVMLNTRQPMMVLWGHTLTCFYNDAFAALMGPERHPGALGRPAHEVWSEIWDAIGPQIDHVLSGSGATWHENQLLPLTRNGRCRDVYWTYGCSPIDDEASPSHVGGIMFVCTETTAQVVSAHWQTQKIAASQKNDDRFDSVFENAPSFVAMLTGPNHKIEWANRAYRRLAGNRAMLGETVAEALPEAVEQGQINILDEVLRSGRESTAVTTRFVTVATNAEAAHDRVLEFIYQPMLNNVGDVTGIFVVGSDVTARVNAERALTDINNTLEQRVAYEVAARCETEEMLRQAQRMEAVGRLTGGIAHDFNNMLQAVTGGINLARRRIAAGGAEGALEVLDCATDAVGRAEALSRRLLTFGGRQAWDPRPVALDELIDGLETLIQRAVGSAVEVELRLVKDCPLVYCDPSQMENALLNLAINAGDAMRTRCGRLQIQTQQVELDETATRGWAGVEPGVFVQITVSDTGTGMPPEVKQRAFEPFFTTKAPGQGTGLGLSQLFGFVREAHGIVRLESEVGEGTAIHLFLPRFPAPHFDLAVVPTTDRLRQPSPIARVTVLLVEAEAPVREFTAEALQELGYRVVEADNGPSALQALREALLGPEADMVNLLVTDVGLPGGLNGRQLVHAARVLVTDLPVLLITGYADDAFDGEDPLDPNMALLGKPFALENLILHVDKLVASRPDG